MALTKDEILKNLGPLAFLSGTWEGSSGNDVAPSDDRGIEKNSFRERLTFEPFGPVDNHEQKLFGLRYATTAWRLGEPDPFHEETGYWLWDSASRHVMRSFMVPRGVVVLAGGIVQPQDREFHLSAEAGSKVFGICSNPFLDREFRTVRYELKVVFHGADEFSYEEDTQILMPKSPEIFHHTDQNRLKRI